MLDEPYKRYLRLEDKLEHDEELHYLKQQLSEHESALREVLSQLSEQQRAVITNYIGICGEIDQRIVEISCFPEEE